jgi:hypothetical protein
MPMGRRTFIALNRSAVGERAGTEQGIWLYGGLGELDQARPCFFNFFIRCF